MLREVRDLLGAVDRFLDGWFEGNIRAGARHDLINRLVDARRKVDEAALHQRWRHRPKEQDD